jgi:hypothetical protein
VLKAYRPKIRISRNPAAATSFRVQSAVVFSKLSLRTYPLTPSRYKHATQQLMTPLFTNAFQHLRVSFHSRRATIFIVQTLCQFVFSKSVAITSPHKNPEIRPITLYTHTKLDSSTSKKQHYPSQKTSSYTRASSQKCPHPVSKSPGILETFYSSQRSTLGEKRVSVLSKIVPAPSAPVGPGHQSINHLTRNKYHSSVGFI